MLKRRYGVLPLFVALAAVACRQEVPRSQEVGNRPPSEKTGAFGQFRALYSPEQDQLATRFLGKGFDALHYQSDDEDGFSTLAILDARRLAQSNAWSPWSATLNPLEVDAPEVLVQPIVRDVEGGVVEDVTSSYNEKTITASLGLNVLKPLKLSYSMNRVEGVLEQVHTFRVASIKPFFFVSYDAEPSSYIPFLHRRFVSDVKRLSAQALVKKYGTHLVTSYRLGAFSSLLVSARERVYTRDETRQLTASAWSNSLSYEQKEKATQQANSLRVIYRQGGSDYIPPFHYQIADFFHPSKGVEGVDLQAWARQIRSGDHAFIDLDRREEVCIPDLIADPLLKLKYLCGIVHEANPATKITYVLTSPETYSSVERGGERVYAMLSSYDTQPTRLYVGNRDTKNLSEKELRGQGSEGYRYLASLDGETGLWSFRYDDDSHLGHPVLYLCRDYKLRTVSEDAQGLRFWVLNPVVPQGTFMQAKLWSNLLLKTTSTDN